MPAPTTLSGPASRHLTTFTVKVDGEVLPGTISVVTIDISREINRISAAALVMHDGDAATQDFVVSSGKLFVPGQTLEIEGGYSSDESLLFRGVIVGQRIKSGQRGQSALHVEVRDAAFRMTLDRNSTYSSELTDSDLFEEVIGRYADLTAAVEATSVTYPEIVQYQVSDWDFLVSRAEKAAMFCLSDDGTLRIQQPDVGQQTVLTLIYGGNVFGLDLDLDARSQFQRVRMFAWDQADQSVISADVDDVAAPGQGNLAADDLAQVEALELRHGGSLQQPEIDEWAKAGLLKSRFSKVRGTIRLQGDPSVKPGNMVEIAGMGDRFNGNAFVSGVRHVLGKGDWETILQLGMPLEWHHEKFNINSPPASGFHPAINGLHAGVVTQLEGDPESEDRILVRLPLISESDDGVWSRLTTLDAGQDRGTVFRPEIGDEVVVAFVNDDPHEPVVLGMLHSSNKPAPIAASDDNHEKGLVTRSGMKLLFNDDTPSITIETPNGNRIEINDAQGRITVADESGNSATMDSDGITLNSSKDIILKATGDISLEGQNVNVAAKASAKVEGSASATLSSSGTTDVKGSLVKIN